MKKVLVLGSLTWMLAILASGGIILQPIGAGNGVQPPDTTVNEPFPTAGNAYCSFTNGCGNIPVGGQTAFMWTAGDFVISSIFSLPTNGVTDLTANWNFQDFLGSGNTETWNVYVNGVVVATAVLPDDNFNGDILNVSGTVNFAPIAPVAGGYQVELILQNTLGGGGGSVAWLDGGTTGLSFPDSTVPEPGSMMLLGSGLLLGALVRRKLSR